MNVHLEQSVDVRDAHVRDACTGGHHPGIVDEQVEREIAGGQRRRDQGTSLLVGNVGPDQGATLMAMVDAIYKSAGSGKSVDVTATVIYKVGPDGKWTEGWINRDDLGMMRQLGVIPTPGE